VKHSRGLKSTNLCYFLCNGLSLSSIQGISYKRVLSEYLYMLFDVWKAILDCLCTIVLPLSEDQKHTWFSAVRDFSWVLLVHFSAEENCKRSEIRWTGRPALCPSHTNLTLSLTVIELLVEMMWLASCLIGTSGNVLHMNWHQVVQELAAWYKIPQNPITIE
jgi:hypothetical protein